MQYHFKGGILAEISAIDDQYSEFPSNFINIFPKNNNNHEVVSTLAWLFFNNTQFQFQIRPCGPSSFSIRVEGNLRTVVDLLFRKGFIFATDRADIEDCIKRFEKIQSNRSLVKNTVTDGQREVLEMIAAPYVNCIIEDVPDLKLAFKILLNALRDIYITRDSSRLIWNHFLRISGLLESFINTVAVEKQNTIFECLTDIMRLYSGIENLSETFIKTSGTIPHITLTREMLVKFIVQQVLNKVANDTNLLTELKIILTNANIWPQTLKDKPSAQFEAKEKELSEQHQRINLLETVAAPILLDSPLQRTRRRRRSEEENLQLPDRRNDIYETGTSRTYQLRKRTKHINRTVT